MNYSADQLIANQKANVDVMTGLSQKAFASFEKLVELNMAATKAVVNESFANLQSLAAVKDVQELVSLQSALAKPMAAKSASYARHVYDIVSGTAAEFNSAFEAKAAEGKKTVASMVEQTLKNAPAGSEAAVNVIKSAMEASNNAVESAQKAAKQAAQLVETNLKAAAEAV